VTGDLDGKVITIVLPDHVASCDIEQILLSELFTSGDFNQIDVGGNVGSFRSLYCIV
jgi:hypothetical protein